MLYKSMKNAILVKHGVDPPSGVRNVAQTPNTEWNQRRAPCPEKLNRTAVDLFRASTESQQGWYCCPVDDRVEPGHDGSRLHAFTTEFDRSKISRTAVRFCGDDDAA
jgi:hypothetical protein